MQHIAILDFGSQYTHLIARRIRELGVLSRIYPADTKALQLPPDIGGIILSGGPQSVYDKNSLIVDPGLLNLGKPILGLCYGHQLLAHLLSGRVEPGKVREYGRAELTIQNNSPLFSGIDGKTIVWMSHGDTVTKLPDGFTAVGSTPDCPNAAMADEKRAIYGLQFHPEVHHTQAGKKILFNFVINICQAEKNWEIENQLDDLIEKIRREAGSKNVFLLVSGGVDSTVCFALLEKALGKERVYGLHIDTGFMRQNESQMVKKSLAQAGYDNLHTVDASQTFYSRLSHVTDPEKKRQIIGQTFLDIKDKAVAELKLDPGHWLLGQGTIYPDTIESGATRHADKIKTHHNRVDAIQEMIREGRVIEPLADFYKDEVRQLGRLLSLPDELINRHPFPGPGLAIRVLCHPNPLLSESKSPLPLLGKEGIKYHLLPIRSVGVQGDNRTYAHPLAIWPSSLPLPEGEIQRGWEWEKLDKLSSQITNTHRHINRVVLLLNPSSDTLTGQLQTAYLTPERVRLLQQIDAIVNKEITKTNLYDSIWQFPVVLIPFGTDNKESVVLRPVVSQEAMTANFARLPKNMLESIVDKIISTGKISFVFYDVTNKPPGTIEWE